MPSSLISILKLKEAKNRRLEDTYTNKQASIVEETLHTYLDRVVSEITNEFNDKPENWHEPEPYRLVKKHVGDAMRFAGEAFYKLGIEYVNRANDSNPFLTERDSANVKTISADTTQWILDKFTDYFRREADIQRQETLTHPLEELFTNMLARKKMAYLLQVDHSATVGALKKLNSFQIDKNISQVATNLSTRAINEAIIDKSVQMLDVPIESITIAKAQYKAAAKTLELKLNSDEILKGGFTPAEYVPQGMLVGRFGTRKESLFHKRDVQRMGMWVTAEDDKVCFEYCLPLEGQTFEMTDPTIPIPGDLDRDSHPNCRCRYMLIDIGDKLESNVIWG